MAQRLVHNGFAWPETFFMPPLYPYLLAAYTFIFGSSLGLLQFLQLVLGSITAVLVFLLAERMFSRVVAIVAFVGYLLYGNALFLDAVYLPNALTALLQMLVLFLLCRETTNSRRFTQGGLLVGLLLGLLILIRAEFLLLIPLLAIVWLWGLSRRKIGTVPIFRSRTLGGLVLGTALVIAPVFLHNLIAGNDPALISFNGGLNFYLGNNPKADGTWQPAYPLVRTGSVTIETLKRNSLLRPDGTQMKPAQSSSYWTGQAWHYITHNPGSFLALAARRLGLFIGNYEIPNNYYYDLARERSWVLKLAFLPFGLILALGVIGMLLRLVQGGLRKADYAFYLFFLVYLLTSVFIFTVSRLRAPLVPLLVIFAASFVVEINARLHAPQAARCTLPWVGAALLIFALSFLPLVNRKTYAVEGHVQAGNIYLEVKQGEKARTEYQQAVRLDPGSFVAAYGLFNSATQLKSKLDAERYSAELYRLSRTPADSVYAFLSTAKLGTMTGNFIQARDYYLRALDQDPANPDTRYLLALVYYTLHDIPAARAQLEQTLSLDPGNQEALKLYGQLPK